VVAVIVVKSTPFQVPGMGEAPLHARRSSPARANVIGADADAARHASAAVALETLCSPGMEIDRPVDGLRLPGDPVARST
jgi:hypothetical protein